jgi:hypothetical protein
MAQYDRMVGGTVEEINGTLQYKASRAVTNGIHRTTVWRSADSLSQPKPTELLRECISCLMIPARSATRADYSCERPDIESKLFKKDSLKNDISLFRKQVALAFYGGERMPRPGNNPTCTKWWSLLRTMSRVTMEQAEHILDLFAQLYLVKYSGRNISS